MWDIRYDGPECPDGCAALTLPTDTLKVCPNDYILSIGEVRSVYISAVKDNTGTFEATTKPGDWTDEASYTSLTGLIGIGDKPKGSPQTIPAPGFTNRVVDRDHSLNMDITDSSQTIYDLVRTLQCAKMVAIWYFTHDGIAHGGADGIIVDVDPGTILNRGKTPVTHNFLFTWSNKFDPEASVANAAPAALKVMKKKTKRLAEKAAA